MDGFHHLSQEEQLKAIMHARRWRNLNMNVVVELMRRSTKVIHAPEKGIAFRPDLWTGAEWRWLDSISPLLG